MSRFQGKISQSQMELIRPLSKGDLFEPTCASSLESKGVDKDIKQAAFNGLILSKFPSETWTWSWLLMCN